jgi:hypothetical protein
MNDSLIVKMCVFGSRDRFATCDIPVAGPTRENLPGLLQAQLAARQICGNVCIACRKKPPGQEGYVGLVLRVEGNEKGQVTSVTGFCGLACPMETCQTTVQAWLYRPWSAIQQEVELRPGYALPMGATHRPSLDCVLKYTSDRRIQMVLDRLKTDAPFVPLGAISAHWVGEDDAVSLNVIFPGVQGAEDALVLRFMPGKITVIVRPNRMNAHTEVETETFQLPSDAVSFIRRVLGPIE